MKIENKPILKANVLSGSNIIYEHGLKPVLAPWFNRIVSASSYVYRYTGSGNRPIAFNAMQVFEDLIFVASWGEGIGIHRINNDGTITNLYYDSTPSNGYAYYNSLAIDEINYTVMIGSYATSGFREYDFSGARNGGTTVVKGAAYVTADGFNGDEPGYGHASGMQQAGPYMYYATEDFSPTVVNRYNTTTETHENLTVVNQSRSMDDGTIHYDKATDMLYVHGRYNGCVFAVKNASTAGATAYQIDYAVIGYGDDGYFDLVVADKDNPDIMWVGAGYRILKLNVAACMAGTSASATLIWATGYDYNYPQLMMSTFNMFEHPEKRSEQILIKSGYGWMRQGGWFDREYKNYVGPRREDSTSYYESDNFYEDDYGAISRPIWSANGTKYWLVGGYSYDGNYVYSYLNDPYEIFEASSIEFGNIAFSDSSNIQAIIMSEFDNMVCEVSGCNMNVFVSNDNGATWEGHNKTSAVHEFSSTGNSFKIKIDFSNPKTKSSYITGNIPITVQLIGDLPLEYPRKFGTRRLASKT